MEKSSDEIERQDRVFDCLHAMAHYIDYLSNQLNFGRRVGDIGDSLENVLLGGFHRLTTLYLDEMIPVLNSLPEGEDGLIKFDTGKLYGVYNDLCRGFRDHVKVIKSLPSLPMGMDYSRYRDTEFRLGVICIHEKLKELTKEVFDCE